MEFPRKVSRRLARPKRIAVGMFNTKDRQRYLGELRSRTRARGKPAPDGQQRCLACGSPKVRQQDLVHAKTEKELSVIVCRSCGHVAAPSNTKDYSTFTSLSQLGKTSRVGSDEKPGREYHMARMAAEILGREGLSVLICGPGRSVDYRWIEKLGPVSKVAIGDLMKLVDDAEWVDLNAPVRERFDIVLCCEVIEHFTDPANDFPTTFKHVKDDGLVVCSTNIYDGGNLSKHNYLFIKGHTSYYTPRALAQIAKQNQVHVDFRLPEAATTKVIGPRKRYVLFSRSQERMQDIACYFGNHVYAPSEEDPQRASKAH